MGNVVVTWGREKEVSPGKIVKTFDVTFTNPYAAGGDTIAAADIEKLMPYVNDLQKIEVFAAEVTSSGHTVALIRSTAKLKLFLVNGTEASGDQSGTTVRCRVEFESFHKFDG